MANTTTQPGLLLIISGPSGVGKTTITRSVEQALRAVFSVSMTTRPRAQDDREGIDYFFVTPEQFLAARERGELLESAEVFGNYYGTPRKPVQDALDAGRLMILEIDVQGAVQVKRAMPDAFAIFVLPPSEDVLLDRLRKRKREEEAVIQRRFNKAKDEIARAKACGVYDEFLVNDVLEETVSRAVCLVKHEMQRRATAAGR